MHNKPISEIYSSSDGKNIAKNIAKKSKSALAGKAKFWNIVVRKGLVNIVTF